MTMTCPRCIVVCIAVFRSCSCCCPGVLAITVYCCILFFMLFFLFLLLLLLSVVCRQHLLLGRRPWFVVIRLPLRVAITVYCCFVCVALCRVVSHCVVSIVVRIVVLRSCSCCCPGVVAITVYCCFVCFALCHIVLFLLLFVLLFCVVVLVVVLASLLSRCIVVFFSSCCSSCSSCSCCCSCCRLCAVNIFFFLVVRRSLSSACPFLLQSRCIVVSFVSRCVALCRNIMVKIDMAPFARQKNIEFYLKNRTLYSYFQDAFSAFIQFAGTL